MIKSNYNLVILASFSLIGIFIFVTAINILKSKKWAYLSQLVIGGLFSFYIISNFFYVKSIINLPIKVTLSRMGETYLLTYSVILIINIGIIVYLITNRNAKIFSKVS